MSLDWESGISFHFLQIVDPSDYLTVPVGPDQDESSDQCAPVWEVPTRDERADRTPNSQRWLRGALEGVTVSCESLGDLRGVSRSYQRARRGPPTEKEAQKASLCKAFPIRRRSSHSFRRSETGFANDIGCLNHNMK
jgi:hypothetical protein